MNGIPKLRNQRGLMMLEVLIALLIFTLGVLGMVKMQAVSTANSVNSEDRATASLLANDLISELWTTQSANAPSDYGPQSTPGTWQYRVNHALRNGVGTLNTTGSTATVTITWDRQMGLNVAGASSVAEATNFHQANYSTQVIIQ